MLEPRILCTYKMIHEQKSEKLDAFLGVDNKAHIFRIFFFWKRNVYLCVYTE